MVTVVAPSEGSQIAGPGTGDGMHSIRGTSDPDSVVAEYESWLKSWASERTTQARTALAKARMKEWGLDGFTAENIQEFMGRPTPGGKPKSMWTRATYYNHFKDLCAWLAAQDYIAADPMPGVRQPSKPDGKPRPLSEAEVDRVLSVVQGDVRTWILLALGAGLRVSEIAALRGEDVQPDGIYVEGKGGKRVTLPCHRTLWDVAQQYPRFGYWFPARDGGHIPGQRISLTVGRLFASLGIEGSIHRCRHVFGTRLLRSGENIRVVQKLMRHSSLATTAAYTAVDEDELRSAVDGLDLGPPAA